MLKFGKPILASWVLRSGNLSSKEKLPKTLKYIPILFSLISLRRQHCKFIGRFIVRRTNFVQKITFLYIILALFVFYFNKTGLLLSHFFHIPRHKWEVYRTEGRAFPFPFYISSCPSLSAIASDDFWFRYSLQICGSQAFSSALETNCRFSWPQSKTWTCGRSLAGTAGSNPAGGRMSLVSVMCCQI